MWHSNAKVNAAENGHLHVLQWLRSQVEDRCKELVDIFDLSDYKKGYEHDTCRKSHEKVNIISVFDIWCVIWYVILYTMK